MRPRLVYAVPILVVFVIPYGWDSLIPHLRLISVGLLGLLGFIWVVRRARTDRAFYIPKVLLPLVAFFLLQLVLLNTISPLPEYGWYWIYTELLVFLLCLFVVDTHRSGWENRFWENALVGIGVFFALLELMIALGWYSQWRVISNSFLTLPPVGIRLRGLFLGHPNFLAGFINLVLPLAFVRFLFASRKTRRLFWLVILMLFLAVEYLTSSRGAWLALAAALATVLLLRFMPSYLPVLKLRNPVAFFRLLNTVKLRSGLTFLLVALAVFPLLYVQTRMSWHGTLSGRLDLWDYSLNLISSSPVWGHGPGTIPFLFTQRSDAIGGDEVLHTHNLWLQIAGEAGALGVILALAAFALLLRAYIAAWRRTSPASPGRASLLAYAGIGTGLLVHGLLDFLFWRLLFTVFVFTILALIYAQAPEQEFVWVKKATGLPVIAGLLVFCLVGMWTSLRGALPYWEGRSAAGSSDWMEARNLICKAAQMNPAVSFYDFQCSLAHAMLAYQEDDLQALELAREYQKQGLEKDPYWYIHWANLASYEWRLGDHDQAISNMRRAVDGAPRLAFLRLNLGWMLEQIGRLEEARNEYNLALCLSPDYRERIFFSLTALREQASQDVCPPDFDTADRNLGLRLRRSGLQALLDGDLDRAEQDLTAAVRADPQSPVPYAYRALLHEESGLDQIARQDLEIALFINDDFVSVLLIAAQFARADGDSEKAMDYLSRAFDRFQTTNLSYRLYQQSYRQPLLIRDTSPFLVTASLTPESAQEFLLFAKHLEKQGEKEKAREVIRWVEETVSQ